MYSQTIETKFTIQDAKNRSSSFLLNHPLDTDLGALKETLRTTAELIDPLVQGVISNCAFTIPINIVEWDTIFEALKETPVAGSDVEEGAIFNFETAIGSPFSVRLPTLLETYILADDLGTVDSADEDIDPFIQRVIAGYTLVALNVSPSDNWGEDITTFVSAFEDFIPSR